MDPVLDNPVAARDAGVERTVGDVAGHLLWPQQPATQGRIVHARDVRAVADGDTPTRLAHQLERLRFEAALGNTEFQYCIVGHLEVVQAPGMAGVEWWP